LLFDVDTVTDSRPAIVGLRNAPALDPSLVGAKAAALARAGAAGLPVLPGFVVTTEGFSGRGTQAFETELRLAWDSISELGAVPLVVRSSSMAEDGIKSSMAGMFTSIVGVKGWKAFRAALDEVWASARVIDLRSEAGEPAPMAVLVQPELDTAMGGVLFGLDPVTGKRDRLVVTAVDGGPDKLVSGTVEGSRYVLSRRGRVLDLRSGTTGGGSGLTSRQRLALARLASRAEREFKSAQDVEWGIDSQGELWMFQSRPVTATSGSVVAKGPILGPGPVAETFPDPVAQLEEDLWVEPLRTAVTEALRLTGTVSRRRLSKSRVVTTVGGRVAADLELFGITKKRSFLARLDPRPPSRRLVAAWRVGRLKAALPALAADLISEVDSELAEVPPLDELLDPDLLQLIAGTRRVLVSLYGHEVLIGLFIENKATAPTAAWIALQDLRRARGAEMTDAQAIATFPSLLVLAPPAIGRLPGLPPTPKKLAAPQGSDELAITRESLRMRARWVQELGARAAWEAGRRAARRDLLADPDLVALFRFEELEPLLTESRVPEDLAGRVRPASPPLPAAFRIGEDDTVVPESVSAGDGVGAGGGRAAGTIRTDPSAVEPGDVLVVRTLDPGLASVLPDLGGLVAETGSELSHLAILAREFGVPTVVGVAGALERFREGADIYLDGSSGEVGLIEDGSAA
jgi:rifampicin phosphotransferase